MKEVTLADALLRRKELAQKVEQLRSIKSSQLFELKVTRKAAHEGFDDILLQVPKLTVSQVTAEYDYYAKLLRLVDGVVQHANHMTKVAGQSSDGQDLFADYPQPK